MIQLYPISPNRIIGRQTHTQRLFSFIFTIFKYLTIIIILLLISLQPISKLWIVVSFQLNQKEIAKKLCVKKEVKNNTCQGKCHLKKQINEAEEQEGKQTPLPQKDKSETSYYYLISNIISTKNLYVISYKHFKPYKNNLRLSDLVADIFHPPEIILTLN